MQRILSVFVFVFSVLSLVTLVYHRSFRDIHSPLGPQSVPDARPLSNADIKISVISFYAAFDSCIKKTAQDTAAVKYCIEANSLFSKKTPSLMRVDGINSVMCSSILPESYEVKQAKIFKTSAQADLQEKFMTTNQVIKVNLINESGIWKVNEVICPAT